MFKCLVVASLCVLTVVAHRGRIGQRLTPEHIKLIGGDDAAAAALDEFDSYKSKHGKGF